ncbi:hypothetical protein ACFSUJ_24935 [Streptomyces lusitanus]|uniref:PH domain-containing protein n=1 Tax=Streptomyces lusitanus TaxID=68232 RepID=A0ABU3JZI5_9ACTN|nr:PH domain-containing protein [Streptomyces lusitanus]
MLRRRVEAGRDGLRFRTVLRWRTLEWDDILRLEDLRVAAPDSRIRTPSLRVAAALRDGSVVSLPVPWTGAADADDFERQLSQLRTLHVRYGRGSLGS